jgi:transposase
MRSKGSAQQLEERRRLAVRRVSEGWTQRQAAEFLGVSERAVGAWVAAWRSQGDEGLKARPHPGRKPFLSAEQEREVLGWLTRPPTDFGFPDELWTARRVAQLVNDRLGVAFHPNYLREWLSRRGQSPQRPAKRARERDEAAIARWVKEDWPRLKKKRAGARPTLS